MTIKEKQRQAEEPDFKLVSELMNSWIPAQSELLKSFSVDSLADLPLDSLGQPGQLAPKPTVALGDEVLPPVTTTDSPGCDLTMVKQLGTGGFGEVWEARQNKLGRAVAVKVIRRDICPTRDEADTRHQFVDTNLRQEGLTAAMLDHPNIVPVYDLQTDDRGFPALAMKLVRGEPWDLVLEKDFLAMAPADFLARHVPILVSVMQAVAFAHSRGIIHRDLKPGQVMLGDYGEVLLMDWGLATVFDQPRLREAAQAPLVENMSTLASASNPAGTLAYMAPEQADDTAARIGPWTDAYLLGAILYELLCGKPPRTGRSVSQFLSMVRLGQVVPLKDASPDRPMPPELVSLCYWCLQPEPTARPQHAGEVLEALKSYESGAGKHEESRKVAAEAEQVLAQAGNDYALLSKCEELIGRAFELWPENAQLAELTPKLRARFATAALEKGDLELAQLHAARAGEQDKPLLLERIDAQRRMQVRRERERRIATGLVIAALIIIVAGSLYYNQRVNSALASAVTARTQAETLIAGLQDKLFGELEAVGKMGMLAELGEQIDGYFDQMSPSDKTGNSQLRHVQSLLTLQQAQSRLGKKAEARETSAQAVKQAAALVAANPKNLDFLAILACAQTRLAGQFYLGETAPTVVLAHVADGMQTLQKLQHERIKNPEISTLEAKAAENISRLVVVLSGNTTSAIEMLGRANQIRELMLTKQPTNPLLLRGKAEHLLAVAQTYIGAGRLQESTDALLLADKIYETELADKADEPGLIAERAQIDFWLGRALERQGDTVAAMEAHTGALEARERLVAFSPDDLTWRWSLAASEAKLAELNLDLDKPDVAAPLLEKAMKLLGDGTAASTRSREFQVTAGTAKVALGRLLDMTNRKEEARQKWTEAVEQFRTIEKSAPFEYFMLRYLVEALLRLDRTSEADETAAKLRQLGYKAAHISQMLTAKGLKPL